MIAYETLYTHSVHELNCRKHNTKGHDRHASAHDVLSAQACSRFLLPSRTYFIAYLPISIALRWRLDS